ncbi:MAG: hypothetical protein JHC93_06915 [Parachlamydiales bacterium]|nr:hypothetical protein [Parachlamydiales bacterium]
MRKKIISNINEVVGFDKFESTTHDLVRFGKFDKILQSVAGDVATLNILENQIDKLANSFKDNHDPLNTKNDVREWKFPGYRIYYIRQGNTIVLLNVGNKQRQNDDIDKADRLAGAYKFQNSASTDLKKVS